MRRRAARFTAACVLASAISQGGAGAALPRVASLNLCTDELVLLLAAPEQIASVTHLSRDPDEFALWRTARRYPANDGSILSIAGAQPDLVVTMGGLARDRERLAGRIGADVVTLPYPQSLADLETSIARLAAALGREARGERLIAALHGLEGSVPRRPVQGLYLGGGGLTLAPGSLGDAWLALAGIERPEDIGTRVAAERLLTDPPPLVLRSDYRVDQAARGNFWPGFRFLDRSGIRTRWTDGRRWTCAGPTLIPEILRLRQEIGQ